MARTEIRRLSENLDDAVQDFAHTWAEDYGQPDWHNAYEYREEGFCIAEEAFLLPEDDREYFTEGQIKDCPESARYLVACAVAYRLAELEADQGLGIAA